MITSVFKRREKKYLIEATQRQTIEAAARQFMSPDDYGRTLVTSVYLDTPDRSIIARSLEKPVYKEKLRIRACGQEDGTALVFLCQHGLVAARAFYGDMLLAIPVFFELKKKYKGIVYKRRVRMSLMGAWALAHGASYEAAMTTYPLAEDDGCGGESSGPIDPSICSTSIDAQIAHEIEAALGRYDSLEPSAAILCWRVAWAPQGEADEPRITFDDELCYIDLAAEDPVVRPILEPTVSVMELKASTSLPHWITDALSSLHVYPQSFSKYGAAACMSAARHEERKAAHA